jgi:hypothetical protein
MMSLENTTSFNEDWPDEQTWTVPILTFSKRRHTMAVPTGITKKTKDNSNKLHRNRAAWMLSKKQGRPQQQFNTRTNGPWVKIMLPRKVND